MNIKAIILYVVIALSMLSCSNDLEPTPPDFISDKLFFSNPENLEAGLNGVYDAIQSSSFFGRMPILLDGVSDNALAHFSSVSDIENFGKGTITPEVSNVIVNAYQGPYVVIQRANTLLSNMENIEQGTVSPSKIDNIRAQARALRAIAYQRLVYLFGDVPLSVEPLSISESIEIARAPRAHVVDFIVSELQEAAGALETNPLDGVPGRFTKQAALAYRAQTLVYEARMGQKSWEDALQAVAEARTIAEAGGAVLVRNEDGSDGLANYLAVFNENNEQNEELLFYVRYDFGVDNGTNLQADFSVVAGTLYLSAHANLANDFYTVAGLPITDPASGFEQGAPYDNRDPRLHGNLVAPGALYTDGSSLRVFNGRSSNSNLRTDYAIRKFTTLNNDIALNRGGLDLPGFRYAELLLLFAEAENQVNGPTVRAYQAINAVRARVNVGEVSPGLSKDAFHDEVIHERRVELAFEGRRWFDLVTLGIADEKINNIDEGLGRAFIPNKQELFPIPKMEVDRNSNLSQNTGYLNN